MVSLVATQATQGWWSIRVQLMLTGKIRGFTHSGTMVGALLSKPMKSAELVLNSQDPPSVVVPPQTTLRAELVTLHNICGELSIIEHIADDLVAVGTGALEYESEEVWSRYPGW